MINDLFNHHDPPEPEGVIRVLKFFASESELLHDFLEQVQLFGEPIIAAVAFVSESILVLKIRSFKNNPSGFDDFFLSELKSFEGVECIYQGEEDEPCQDDT